MKKFLLTLVFATCLLLAVGTISIQAKTYTGSCGENATYSLSTTTGKLKISGSGEMYNYSELDPPWYEQIEYIEKVEISNGITSIGDYAFFDCWYLEDVSIADTVICIGDGAFYYSGVTYIELPENVTSIGNCAFYDSYLEEINIPDGVTFIGEGAFAYTNIQSISIPSGITCISKGAFMGTSIDNIVIPETIKIIEDGAFMDCTSLLYALYEGSKNDLTIGVYNEYLTKVLEYAYASGRCGTTCTWEFNMYTGELRIGGTGDMKKYSDWEQIPWYEYSDSIKIVTIEKGVTSISGGAFSDCNNVNNVYYEGELKDWCQLTFGSEGASTPMYWGANLYINKTLVEGDLIIPDGVTAINDYAFYECDRIKSVVVPDSVESIGERAFAFCDNLISVKLGNRVASIENYAFYDCEKLETIEFSNSVKSIEYCAFQYCFGLIDVYYNGSEADWSKIEIGFSNDELKDAFIYYNGGEQEPIIPDTDGSTPEIGKTIFVFTPIGAENGDIIAVLATKDGVSTSYAKTYSGSGTVTFEIEDGFDSMKILIWDSYESMQALMEEYARVE